jgi:hypothetical protein
MTKKKDASQRFTYGIGHLMKSPCRDCETRESLPECFEKCKILGEIRTILSEKISFPLAASASGEESYTVAVSGWEQL